MTPRTWQMLIGIGLIIAASGLAIYLTINAIKPISKPALNYQQLQP